MVLLIAIPGIIIGSSSLTLKTFFEGSGQASIIPKVQTIPVVLQVGIAYFLISLYGLIGAAISFSIGFSLNLLINSTAETTPVMLSLT